MLLWVKLSEFSAFLPEPVMNGEEERALLLLGVATDVARMKTGYREWDENTCPPAVKYVVMAGAARIWNNPGALQTDLVGDVTNTYQGTSMNLFIGGELDILRGFRRSNGLTSVQMTRGLPEGGDTLYVYTTLNSQPPVPWEVIV